MESGSPAELLKVGGLFARLHQLQADITGQPTKVADAELDTLMAMLRTPEALEVPHARP